MTEPENLFESGTGTGHEKTQAFMRHCFAVWLIQFCLFLPCAPCSEGHQQALSALASLYCCIQQESQSINSLAYEAEDIQNLWEKALPLDDSLTQWQHNYWHWHRNSSSEAKEGLKQCAQYLRSLWVTAKDEQAEKNSLEPHRFLANNLENNPLVNKRIKKQIAPFLLPKDFPFTPMVEHIFSSTRATFDFFTLIDAGFNILHLQPRSYIAVVSHPAVPDFLFKLYLDIDLREKHNKPGWKWFVRRCSGAQSIKKVISNKKIKHFTVPTKYIYVLPPATIPAKTALVDPKLAVLIVQDMHLVSDEINYLAWKNYITPEILNELFLIIAYGNGSSYRPDNIPYTREKTFAFIDTEYPDSPQPDFISIRPYLSIDMCSYWDKLIQRGGP